MKIPLEWLKEYVQTNKSPKELAESFTALGLMLDKIVDNKVLDLEHRMDRSDWLSITGCARDLAAYEKAELKKPELYLEKGKPGGSVKIEVKCPDLVRRFNTRVFRDIAVKESPEWLKKRLNEYGMAPINNIVDITNYVMVEIGNPMHAQDLDKFEKQEIIIRKAKNKEKITTFDGSDVELDDEMFVLTQNDKPIVIGGIVGGAKTGVDFDTKNIVLDAGNYDQANIRKNARKLKIANETVLRYDKFLHPKLTEIAIERATKLILELAGGEYYENTDYYPNPIPETEMKLRSSRVHTISGMDISIEEARNILIKLEYEILEETENELKVVVPYFRTDVEVEDDIVSDVLRIYGYEKIPTQLMNQAPPKEITSEIYKFEDKLRDILVNLGLHEHITDPLVTSKENGHHQVKLENSQSSEKNALRTNIYETLAPVADTYKKHGIKKIGLFEIGKVYTLDGRGDRTEDYSETRVVEVIYASDGSPYEKSIKIKELYYGLLQNLGISDREIGKLKYDSFSIETEKLMKAPKTNLRVKEEYQNKITEDVSLQIKLGESFGTIYDKIKKLDPRIVNVWIVEEYVNSQNMRSVLVRLEFLEKDITKEESAKIKEKVVKTANFQP